MIAFKIHKMQEESKAFRMRKQLLEQTESEKLVPYQEFLLSFSENFDDSYLKMNHYVAVVKNHLFTKLDKNQRLLYELKQL